MIQVTIDSGYMAATGNTANGTPLTLKKLRELVQACAMFSEDTPVKFDITSSGMSQKVKLTVGAEVSKLVEPVAEPDPKPVMPVSFQAARKTAQTVEDAK